MAILVRAEITDVNNVTYSFIDIHSFRFNKDFYTPFTIVGITLPIRFWNNPAKRLKLFLGTKLVHDGFIDTWRQYKSAEFEGVTIVSKGFTALTAQNNILPGLYDNLTLDQVFGAFITFPNVTHEANSSTNGYIYFAQGTSFFEAAIAYCMKNFDRFPYIEGTNNIRYSLKENPTTTTLNDKNLISCGKEVDYTRLKSHLNYSDITGDYGKGMQVINSFTQGLGIVRKKYSLFDRRYTHDPILAPLCENKYALRARQKTFGEYSGYSGEDLCDLFTITKDDLLSSKQINRIQINGTLNGGVRTKLWAYFDAFCNL